MTEHGKAYRIPCPVEQLRQLLMLDAETGKLFWLPRPKSMFSASPKYLHRVCSLWNGNFANKEAFTALSEDGYRIGAVLGIGVLGHRVVWALHCGEWPTERLDHRNGDPSDNRPQNLREVTQSENCRNRSMQSNNTSGVTGVYHCITHKKWKAYISDGTRQKNLGTFDEKSDAIKARQDAMVRLEYHETHGVRPLRSQQAVSTGAAVLKSRPNRNVLG